MTNKHQMYQQKLEDKLITQKKKSNNENSNSSNYGSIAMSSAAPQTSVASKIFRNKVF